MEPAGLLAGWLCPYWLCGPRQVPPLSGPQFPHLENGDENGIAARPWTGPGPVATSVLPRPHSGSCFLLTQSQALGRFVISPRPGLPTPASLPISSLSHWD